MERESTVLTDGLLTYVHTCRAGLLARARAVVPAYGAHVAIARYSALAAEEWAVRFIPICVWCSRDVAAPKISGYVMYTFASALVMRSCACHDVICVRRYSPICDLKTQAPAGRSI